jgi:hypothetical protein
MTSSGCIGLNWKTIKMTRQAQVAVRYGNKDGGRSRI